MSSKVFARVSLALFAMMVVGAPLAEAREQKVHLVRYTCAPRGVDAEVFLYDSMEAGETYRGCMTIRGITNYMESNCTLFCGGTPDSCVLSIDAWFGGLDCKTTLLGR